MTPARSETSQSDMVFRNPGPSLVTELKDVCLAHNLETAYLSGWTCEGGPFPPSEPCTQPCLKPNLVWIPFL